MAKATAAPRRSILLISTLALLAGCGDFDIDLRNNGANTSNAVVQETAPRPEADSRGVISYPSYQVVLARRGDRVSDVAARIGVPADQLARHNGVAPDAQLRAGEILALPVRIPAAGGNDITAIAGSAIERADGERSPQVLDPQGSEPIRHQVLRGETAYTIARLYNVSVRSLADWNGLGPELEVREGQYLLIPLAVASDAVTTAPLPGGATGTPTPPSAATPLPAEETTPPASTAAAAAPLPSPNLGQDRSATSARFVMPVQGSIIHGYQKGKNDGIDIAAGAGTAVGAAGDGTVAAITKDTDQVPVLVLRHDDTVLTIYSNIDQITVEKGDTVKRGQKIAVVRSGNPTFLHFEVREGFDSVDPLPYLQ